MCELFGVSANRPVNLRLSMPEWRGRARWNPDGFGFAYWEGTECIMVKGLESLCQDHTNAAGHVAVQRSCTFLCHVRHATTGAITQANTHPFQASLPQKVVFAHNGCVNAVRKRHLNHYVPQGETDSEHAFLWLLEQLHGVAPQNFAAELKRQADDVRQLGRFNFIMTDGITTYAYADDQLHYIEREKHDQSREFELHDTHLSFRLGDHKCLGEKATLIATLPLSNERGWTAIPSRSLLLVRNGIVEEIIR